MTMLPAAREPAGNRRWFEWRQAMALPIFLVALSLYGLTLAPTVVSIFDDSLEFQLVTYQLAIAHPTGYPLYTLLGWIFTRLPLGDVAYRVNLMSAVFGALTVALVYLIGLDIAPAPRRPWTGVAAAALGGLALAVSPVFWSQATVAEVYTLNAALVAGILWLLVRGAQEMTDDAPAPFVALAFLFGLALAHHRTVLLLLPAIVLYLWQASVRPRPAWLKLAAAFTLPLLLYLYLPLRGHVGSLDGSYTNTLAGFWRHVSAGGYGVFIFENPFGAQRGADFYFSLVLAQFGPLGLAAGLGGLAALLRRRAGVLTGVAFLSYLVFNLFYRVADIEVFFIPLFLIWAVWIGAAVGWLLGGPQWLLNRLTALTSRPMWLPGGPQWLRLFPALAAVVLFGGQLLALLVHNWPALDRSGDWTVYDNGRDLMGQPLEAGAVIVGILGETTLVRYFQATQGLRPDLLTVAADREPERLEAVTRRLEEGKAVYLMRELPGAPERWSLSAVGPLIRVHSQPVLEAPVPANVGATLTPEIVLHGYALGRPAAHVRSRPVRLALTWQATAPVGRQLKISARLIDAAGQLVAQADAAPVHFAYPTTAWRPGEFIVDVYDLALPASLPPGDYTPLVILYDPAQGAAEVGQVTLPPMHLP